MRYGKIENGNVVSPIAILFDNGGVIINPSHEQWIDNGYLPIEDERPAEIEGYYQESTFAVVDGVIKYTYSYILNPIVNYDNV